MSVSQNTGTSNVTVNCGNGTYVRWRDVINWLSAKTFGQLTFDQMMQYQWRQRQAVLWKKNFSNVKHKIKTVSGEEFDDDEHDETGDDHATNLMSRL
jgi:hypothetical protein